MNKLQRERNKKVQVAMSDLKKLMKRHGLEIVRTATNRYFAAVAKVAKLKRQVADADAEIKKFLGSHKI